MDARSELEELRRLEELERKAGGVSSPAAEPAPAPSAVQALEQTMGPSDFTKAFASTPARMLKSAMQMVGAGEYVPEGVSLAAAEGDKSLAGRILGDVAGTGGVRAAAGPLAQAVQKLAAATGPAARAVQAGAASATGAGQGAITSPDEQEKAATYGAVGGLVAPAAAGLVRAAGRAAPHILGATTGVGSDTVKQAYKSAPGFVENMRGTVPESSVVESARKGIQAMRDEMYQRYATAKGGWAADKTPLAFKPILQAEDAASSKFGFEGVPQPGVTDVKSKVSAILADWQKRGAQNPNFFTVEGFDALKRHLQDVVPDNVANRTGRAYVTEVVNGVKKAITEQAPKYKAAMNDYWERSNELDEVVRSLSLGDKTTVDSALRKLQTLTRPHAGQRIASAETLERAGADIIPQVSGQAMSEWAPHGMQRVGGVLAGLANPALLPAFSPRIVGETARAAGMVANNPTMAATIMALRRATPAGVRNKAQSEE